MKRFYRMLAIMLMIVSLVFMISCGDDDDDDDPTTPTTATPTPSDGSATPTPSDGSATPTPSPGTCGGVQYESYCWYYGDPGLSCDTVCAGKGGCNGAGITYAGSPGSATACDAILNALGAPADTFGDGMDEADASLFALPAVGCSYDADDGDRMVLYPGTCNTGTGNIRRACACNQ